MQHYAPNIQTDQDMHKASQKHATILISRLILNP